MSTQQPLSERPRAELESFRATQQAAYDALVASGLKLDLTRGKPSAEQLDLADGMLALPATTTTPDGVDARNYGGLAGVTALRDMFAELLGLETNQVSAQGTSSLTLMKDVLSYLWLKGGVDSDRPWGAEEKVRFVCPVPGYDRHFTLLEWFGIEMVPVPMTDSGPDADAVAALVAEDASIKGMWLVPTYANPTGQVTTQEVAERLASMPTAAPDFKIFWDNAYALHHLTRDETKTADIVSLAAVAGHPHRPVLFASTSKITYAGAGVAFVGGSVETVDWFHANLGLGSIGPDKVNHLRHLEFFGSPQGVRDHMAKHRDLLAPKFAEVERILERAAGRARHRVVEPAARRLLRQPGRAARHREPGDRAGQGGRGGADPRRVGVPVPRRPRRHQHPARALLPDAGRGDRRHGGRRHLRAAGGGGEAARVSSRPLDA